jgi:hypothetical protein
MTDADYIKVKLDEYRREQERLRLEISATKERGFTHYDPDPKYGSMTDTTEEFIQRRLDMISHFDKLIELYSKDLER